MKIVDTLRHHAGAYLLKNEYHSQTRQSVACGFASATKLGILYDASLKENYDAAKHLVRRLRGLQKDVRSLGFINSRRMPNDQLAKLGMDFFTLGDLNWHLKPVAPITTNFTAVPFDILINLSLTNVLPLEYINAESNAKFKIGRYNPRKQHYYDFMIQLQPGDNIESFIASVEHYLQIINADKTK